ncbi:LOW QUALITY PROTEIN: Hypothetical protein PHPALM_20089 [Phytophthora palmivora]|uniref:Uncharacterized protein n=1 Tax=Phytophthora palmivora TaxID=4796 RepID=A0A2P4XFQ1_9STRA|nr:LOW QUALITY PROTEIN: Hypothetical protein PHPALM_20089 [Phytophthora palmivora]
MQIRVPLRNSIKSKAKSLHLSEHICESAFDAKANYQDKASQRILCPVVSKHIAERMHHNALERCHLIKELRTVTMANRMERFGIELPTSGYPVYRESDTGRNYLLNKPTQRDLSELARRSGASLPTFVEMVRGQVRGQTAHDYRPNKSLVPEVLAKLCTSYQHLDNLKHRYGNNFALQTTVPPVTESISYNIRKEQDAWRCLVLDADLLDQWPEIIISPFGVVDKGGNDASISGRTIHDLSYPEGDSINDCTDPDSAIKPEYSHCDAVATEILRAKREHPHATVEIMAGDVASAFRNIRIHSNSVYLFAGKIEEANVLVIELSAPFGWSGSPGFYEVVGGAISHIHGFIYKAANPTGFFNYHWVDDHINVAPNVGTTLSEAERSLRFAMEAILGVEAINNEKFTQWKTRQRVLGLEFDSVVELVSMPQAKIDKARGIVASAYSAKFLTRKAYCSLMDSLRHVATCLRAARPFHQRLRVRQSNLNRFHHVPVPVALTPRAPASLQFPWGSWKPVCAASV